MTKSNTPKPEQLLYRKPVNCKFPNTYDPGFDPDDDDDDGDTLARKNSSSDALEELDTELSAHFDFASNNPASLSTGCAIPGMELRQLLLQHHINKIPLPPGYSIEELHKAYNHIESLMGDDENYTDRLPVWEGDLWSGPWGKGTKRKPDQADTKPDSPKKSKKPVKKRDSDIVRATYEDSDGSPIQRLAVRLNVPWRNGLTDFHKKENANIFLRDGLTFLIEHHKQMEASGIKMNLSPQKLRSIRSGFDDVQRQISAGNVSADQFELVKGMCRVGKPAEASPAA